jgi:nickel-dependent lactate racemase
MAADKEFHVERIPYGKGEIEIQIPKKNFVAALMPQYKPGLKDEAGAVRKALENPIGTKRLKEIVRGKKNAVIVVNDITRPTASYKFLPSLLQELKKAGIKNDQILFLVATGTHRSPPGRRLFRRAEERSSGNCQLGHLEAASRL